MWTHADKHAQELVKNSNATLNANPVLVTAPSDHHKSGLITPTTWPVPSSAVATADSLGKPSTPEDASAPTSPRPLSFHPRWSPQRPPQPRTPHSLSWQVDLGQWPPQPWPSHASRTRTGTKAAATCKVWGEHTKAGENTLKVLAPSLPSLPPIPAQPPALATHTPVEEIIHPSSYPEKGANFPSCVVCSSDHKLETVCRGHARVNASAHIADSILVNQCWTWQSWFKCLTMLQQHHCSLPPPPKAQWVVVSSCNSLLSSKGFENTSRTPNSHLSSGWQQWHKKTQDSASAKSKNVDDDDCTCHQFITHADSWPLTKESKAQAFNGLVQSGCLHQAVRWVTTNEGRSVLHLDSKDVKTGQLVSQVLADKHPEGHHILAEALEDYSEALESLQLQANAESCWATAWKLSDGADPSRTDAAELQHWIFCFGVVWEAPQDKLIQWIEWLANDSTSWAAHRAVMACCLVATNKQLGVCPVGIGMVCGHLFAKVVISHASFKTTLSCSSTNLCAGLPAGIECAVHILAQDRACQGNLPLPEDSEDLDPSQEDTGLT